MSTVAGSWTEDAAERRREHRAWYWYDWANSAFVTTTLTVLFSPYLTTLAKRAACPGRPTREECTTVLHVLGVPVAPGSLALYTITAGTVISAVLLPLAGAIADRSASKRRMLAGLAWVGSLAGAAMWFLGGDRWQLGVVLAVVSVVCLACAQSVYDAILIEISTPDERDGVSSRGWAFGYLGGGLLLLVNLGMVSGHEALGLSEETAVRASLLSAGVWWALFTIVPYRGLKDRPVAQAAGTPAGSGPAQLLDTLRDLRNYPQTMLFLLAYLIYNDGVQTVIYASSVYGQEQLHLPQSALITTILVVQFVAFFGAMGFGGLAARIGAHRSVLFSLALWCVVVSAGYFLPDGRTLPFVLLGVALGITMGGCQALSRSLYSQLVPRGREAEYFGLYQATERGMSWFGTLMFGLVFQVLHSYRYSIVALAAFFVLGGLLLARVRLREGIAQAGNPVPAVI